MPCPYTDPLLCDAFEAGRASVSMFADLSQAEVSEIAGSLAVLFATVLAFKAVRAAFF